MKRIALLPLLCLLLAPASAAPRPTATSASLLRLAGNGWEAGFRDGVLVSLRNRLCGETFAVPAAPAPLTGVRRGSDTVLGTEGEAANARLAVSAKRLDAAWTGGVQLTQTAAAAGDFLALNQEATALTPPLVGVQWGLAAIPRDVTVLAPGHSGLAFGPSAPDGVWRFDYPSSWEAQFVLLQGKQGGFLISARDTAPLFKRLTVRRSAGVTSLEFETQATAPFEAVRAVRSATWTIRPYRGSWQVGARLYREWAERAFGLAAIRAARPRWAAKIRCVCTVPMETQLLDELARRLNPAQTLLYIPSWRRDGYDRNYPDYTAVPEFGAWLARAHALGFRVMAHVNYFGCDPLHPLYQQFKNQQLCDPFTKEPLWWEWNRANPPIKFAYINPASRAWRQLFVGRMKELCTRYPIDALHLDQTLCMYNDHNGALDGMNSMQGNLALHRELRRELPQVALSGEGLDEITYRYEEFAQRHLFGLNHADGAWNDRMIRMAHPISSAIFTPHTAIYGYLGMANPSAGGLYQAWLRGYDHFGVLPTLSYPNAQQLRADAPLLSPFFAEARFFQRTQALPDFQTPWPADVLFLYRTASGGRAARRRNQGVVLTATFPGSRQQDISRRIEGCSQAALPGSIPHWIAYDAKRLIGLDPEQSYLYLPQPRAMNAFHIEALPSNAVVRAAGLRGDLVTVRLEDRGAVIARLWEMSGAVTGGVRLQAGAERRYPGGAFQDPSGGNSAPETGAIFLHPPWRATGKRDANGVVQAVGLGISFLEYRLKLPARPQIRFETGVCLRAVAVGKSDGVNFHTEARCGGQVLSAERHAAGADPQPLSLDLSPFAGKEILLRLETGPGPRGDVTFDHALFVNPRVTATDPTARTVVCYSPRPIRAVVGSAGCIGPSRVGPNRYALKLPLPGGFTLAFTEPSPVTLPLDLRTAPHIDSLAFADGTLLPPFGYSVPSAGEAAVAGNNRPALAAHPPNNGQLSVDYLLHLPMQPAVFTTAVGLRDGSRSTGVGFLVRINGQEVWRTTVLPDVPWQPLQIDLAAYAGKDILLSLVTDSLGGYDFDWAVWGEPRLMPKPNSMN